jgi:hypothetical protein
MARNQAKARSLTRSTEEERVMAGKPDETSTATQRRQYRQQIQQQQAQQQSSRHGPGLPEKEHQTKHNAVSDTLQGRFTGGDQ